MYYIIYDSCNVVYLALFFIDQSRQLRCGFLRERRRATGLSLLAQEAASRFALADALSQALGDPTEPAAPCKTAFSVLKIGTFFKI